MVDTIFRSLLHCNDCHHTVESHSGVGCSRSSCACELTRDNVIDSNIELEKAEYSAKLAGWGRDE